MNYSWNGLRFELPAGLVDQTILTFADDVAQPTFTVTLTVESRGAQAFAAYVDAQLKDVARALPSYESIGKKDARAKDKPAVVVEHRARSPQGQAMRQRQAYVDTAGAVAILTVTFADKANAKADAAFDQILQTLG